MAAPVALAGIAATAVGGVTSAIGNIFQGQATSQSYQYQAQIAQINAQVAKQNAAYAQETGEVEAQQSGMQTRAQIGQTKAIQGASGLDVNTGSGAAVRGSEAEIGVENQNITRANAAKAAYGYEVNAAQFTNQASLDVASGANAKTAGNIGAFSSILGGVGSVASKWSQASSQGIFSGSGSGFLPSGSMSFGAGP